MASSAGTTPPRTAWPPVEGAPAGLSVPPERTARAGGPTGARARQRADTRERIFEMALREFREAGLGGAQVDRIAKQAGVARGTFYFHFPTKDDVMLELARRIHVRILARVEQIKRAEPGLRDFLLQLNDALIDEHARVSEAGLHAEVLALYIRRPYDLRDTTQSVPSLTDEIARYLRDSGGVDGTRSPLDPEELAVVIMSSLFGVLARVPPGEPVRQTCRALIEILVLGLAPTSAPETKSPAGPMGRGKSTTVSDTS